MGGHGNGASTMCRSAMPAATRHHGRQMPVQRYMPGPLLGTCSAALLSDIVADFQLIYRHEQSHLQTQVRVIVTNQERQLTGTRNALAKIGGDWSDATRRLREWILEPFFTTKEPGRGPGRGLAFCRGIIDNFGGTIELRSEVGIGTEFVVSTPAVADAPSMLADTLRRQEEDDGKSA